MRCLGHRGPEVVQRPWYRGLKIRSPSGGGPLSGPHLPARIHEQKGWRVETIRINKERSSRSRFPPSVGEGTDRERGEEAVQFGLPYSYPSPSETSHSEYSTVTARRGNCAECDASGANVSDCTVRLLV
jgi:hypothetical protein